MFKARFGYVGFDSKRHIGNRTIRIAWDGKYSEQYKIKKAKDRLLTAGYTPENVMMFIQCNFNLSYEECLKKLDLCKVWGCRVCDCYFDGQVERNIKPVFWRKEQIVSFRAKVRKHNQLVICVDPEIKEAML